MNDITAITKDARDQMVADLTAYIECETPSDDRAALTAGLEWVLEWINTRIGAPDATRIVEGVPYGDIAVLDYAASAGGQGSIAFLCHYDTVWPLGSLAEWPVTVDGDRLTGPGAFDMKSGLIQAVWAIDIARRTGRPVPAIRIVLNGDEEIGSPASRSVIEEAVGGCGATLVFESSAEGKLKTARKGVGIFELQVRGIAGHAGLDPEKGVSAIDEIARLIVTLHDASDLTAGTTVNVGIVSGGTRSNVTAGSASAMIDVRVANDDERARIDRVFESLTPKNSAASIGIAGGWNRPVMERSNEIAELFGRASVAATALGFDVEETSVGGASDGNYVAALGLPVLDGLGAVGDGAHARHEWISINGMLERTAIVAQLLGDLASDPLATSV